MHNVQALGGLSYLLCGLLQPLCMMCRRYVGCYGLYVGCYSLYVWCVDDVLAVASSMHDAQALCELLHPLCGFLQAPCGLLHPLCMLHRRYEGCYRLYA